MMIMERKELVFVLRLSKEEKEKIFDPQKKTQLSKSEYCRRILLGASDTIFSKEDMAVRDDIRNQMRWISANVNQIAKALNGMLNSDRPVTFSDSQLQIIDRLKGMIAEWAKAKRRIL